MGLLSEGEFSADITQLHFSSGCGLFLMNTSGGEYSLRLICAPEHIEDVCRYARKGGDLDARRFGMLGGRIWLVPG